jgi:integrase
MASISNNGGRRSIQFVGEDDKRRTIRLGKCDQRTAAGVKLHIERLEESKRTGMPLHTDTVNWLGSIGDELHQRIARCGLINPREDAEVEDITLGGMTTAYIERRKADMKPWSIKMLKQGRGKLVGFFGEGKAVGEITAAEAMDFKRNLASQHSGAYVAKIVLISRQFFKDAVDRELLVKSPFAKVKAGSQKNPQRQRFISQAVIDKAIEYAPDIEWKLIIALARYGGVRVPSEVLALRWTDVYWDQAKVLVRASKTEHHVGKESRLIPLFPELKTYLLQAFEQAEDGAVYVINRYRDPAVNIRTQFLRILAKAGIEPWPKLFQNLRSSRQTELTETWPAHIVCAWMGNSELVARDHYLQITEEHFAKAAGGGETQGGAESGAALAGFASQPVAPSRGDKTPTPEPATTNDDLRSDASACETASMGDKGFEPLTSTL